MKKKEFNKIKPYVYWLKNLTTGQKYFGVRWKNATRLNRTPNDDFGKYYFTSSENLKKDFKDNPKNYRYKLLYTFDTPEEARDFETNFTKKIVKDKRWINRSSWPVVIKSPEQQKKHGEYISKIMKGRVFSTEWKKKISKAKMGTKNAAYGKPSPMRGKKYSDEVRLKISEGHKGQKAWNKGIKYSKERRAKMSGWKQTDEAKRKMSLAVKSRVLTPERKKQLSDLIKKAAKNRVYKPLTDEQKRKQSLALKGRKRSPETGIKISQKLKGRKLSEETKKKISNTLKNRINLSKIK